MFAQSRPKLNIRAVIRDVLDEEQELLIPLGQDFLAGRLEEAEDRLRRWERYLADRYPDGEIPPRGDAETWRSYQIERALIQRLAAQAPTQSFPIVHQRALKAARRRVQFLLSQGNITERSLAATRFEARLEQELLIELWARWRAWLKPRGARSPRH